MYHLIIFYRKNDDACILEFNDTSVAECLGLVERFAQMLAGGYEFNKAIIEFEKVL